MLRLLRENIAVSAGEHDGNHGPPWTHGSTELKAIYSRHHDIRENKIEPTLLPFQTIAAFAAIANTVSKPRSVSI